MTEGAPHSMLSDGMILLGFALALVLLSP